MKYVPDCIGALVPLADSMIVKLIVTQASGGCKEDAGGALRDPETERPRQTRVV